MTATAQRPPTAEQANAALLTSIYIALTRIEERLTRVETRLVRLMLVNGTQPDGTPVGAPQQLELDLD